MLLSQAHPRRPQPGRPIRLNWREASGSVGVVYGTAPSAISRAGRAARQGPGSKADWDRLQKVYGFKDEAEALAYRLNPVDNLDPLAKARYPTLHGDATPTRRCPTTKTR